MAVAFYVPDEEGSGEPVHQNASGASSVMHSPPLSPVSPDHLIQAFYEALYRCSQGNGPTETPQSPISPTCGSPSQRIFFPPGHFQANQPSPSHLRTPESPHPGGSSFVHSHTTYVPRRMRLSSVGDEIQEDDREINCASASSTTTAHTPNDLDLHYRSHMEAREQLQLFQGRVPPPKTQKKHKKVSKPMTQLDESVMISVKNDNNEDKAALSEPKSKELYKSWHTIVTAVVIAIGCGYIVSR